MGLDNYISKQFGNPAGLGGKVISHIMNRQNRPLYEQVVRLLPLTALDSVLDIGCGNGYVTDMFAQKYDCTFTGIDISPSIIKAAIRRNRRLVENGKMDFICGNMNEMGFVESSFDKAFTVNTVYFWENLDTAMAAICRILKPGGIFINALYTDETLSRFSHTRFGYKRFSTEELTKAGESAGFTAEVVPVLGDSAYCIIYLKAR